MKRKFQLTGFVFFLLIYQNSYANFALFRDGSTVSILFGSGYEREASEDNKYLILLQQHLLTASIISNHVALLIRFDNSSKQDESINSKDISNTLDALMEHAIVTFRKLRPHVNIIIKFEGLENQTSCLQEHVTNFIK